MKPFSVNSNCGHRLRTSSDSEIALHLYEDFGVQCLHRLRGEFAFVIWDDIRPETLRCPRPFRYQAVVLRVLSGTLYLASEVKALFAAGVPARWDEEIVYHAVNFGGHQMRTLYDGVFQVPPGHYLIATEKHVHCTSGTSITPARKRPQSAPMRTMRPSSGMHSKRRSASACARTCLWASISAADWIPARSWGWRRGIIPSRSRFHADLRARGVRRRSDSARRWRPRWARSSSRFRFGSAIWPTRLPTRLRRRRPLCINAHGVAKYLLSRAVRDAGYKVVITGEGSDEILGGYPHFRRDMLLYNREGRILRRSSELLTWLEESQSGVAGIAAARWRDWARWTG